MQNVDLSTSRNIDVTSMTLGTRYYVTVRAWNGAGLSATAVSDGFLRDLSPPTPGHVFLATRHAADHASDDVTTLPVAWHGFHDMQSGVTSFSLALYDVNNLATPVVGFQDVGFRLKYTYRWTGLALQHGHR
jgi:hypothetical protein